MKKPIKENKMSHINDFDQTLHNIKDDIKPFKTCKISEKMAEIQLGIEENQQKSKKLSEIPKNSKWSSSYVHKKGASYFCKSCGRKFKSPRAVFGHLRSHSKKNVEVVSEEIKRVSIPRKKRSFGRYKIHTCSSNNSSWSNLNHLSSATNVVDDYDDEMLDVVASLLFLANGGYSSVDHVFDDNDYDDDHSVNIVHNSDVQVPKQCAHFEGLRSGCGSCEEKFGEFHGCCCELSKIKDETFECGPVSYIEFLPVLPEPKIKDRDVGEVLSGDTICGNMSSCAPASRGTIYETTDVVDQVFDVSKSGTCGLSFMTNLDSIEIGLAEKIDHKVGLYDSESYNETAGVFNQDRMGENLSIRCCGLGIEDETKNESVDVIDQVFDICSTGITAPTIANSCVDVSQRCICNVCDRFFPTRLALRGHRLHCRSETKKKTWEFKCVVCGRTFPSGQALGGHKRAHFKRNMQSSYKVDEVACEKETMVAEAVKEQKNVDACGDDIFQAVDTDETRLENEACCGEIQQLFKERDTAIMSSENIPLLV